MKFLTLLSCVVLVVVIAYFTSQGKSTAPQARNLNLIYLSSFELEPQVRFNAKSELLIKSGTSLQTFSLEKREALIKKEVSANSIISAESDLLLCTWQNFEITKPDQTATTIEIFKLDNSLKQTLVTKYKTNSTVRPITCTTDKLYAIDNYHGSPERIYEINLETQKLLKLEKGIPNGQSIEISGTDTTKIVINGKSYQINAPNIFKQAIANESYLILVGSDSSLWMAQL